MSDTDTSLSLESRIDAKFDAFEERMVSFIEREIRAQTRFLITTWFAAVGTFAAAVGATAARLRL